MQSADTNPRLDPAAGFDQSIRILQGLLRDAEASMEEAPTAQKLELIDSVTKLTRAFGSLLCEKRKYEESTPVAQGFDADMSAFLDWIDNLPPKERQQLIGRVAGLLPAGEDAEIV
jgi:hypothetical protein